MRGWLLFAGVLVGGLPVLVSAQQATGRDGLVLRVNGSVTVAAGEVVGSLVVIKGDATVAGIVTGRLVIVNGTARVTGRIEENAVVARGHLDLRDGAVVDGNVLLYGSTLSEAPSAEVTGRVHDEAGLSFSARATWLLWLSTTLVFVAGGLLFATLAGGQLVDTVRIMAIDPAQTVIGAVVLWVGLPIAALLAFVTVIGLPLGFVILFMVVPAVAFLGYLASGTLLGAALVRRPDGWRQPTGGLHVEAVVGLLTLQLVALVPLFGGVVVVIASAAGAGALAVRSWRKYRGARNGVGEQASEAQIRQPA